MEKISIQCPLCEMDCVHDKRYKFNTDGYLIICGRCGHYKMTDDCKSTIEHNQKYKDKLYILSGLSRELYDTGGEPPTFILERFEETLKNPLIPSLIGPKERANRFVQAIERRSCYYGQKIAISLSEDYPLAYSQYEQEFEAIIDLLIKSNFLERNQLVDPNSSSLEQLENLKEGGDLRVTLTAKGWDLANELGKKNVDSKQAFVAIWFRDEKKSRDAIVAAIKTTDYTAMCIDEEYFSDRIIDKALAEISKSRFMVADLTGNRRSVFYEIGFARGLGIDIIYLLDKKWKEENENDKGFEFYVSHYQVYQYDNTDEIGDLLKDVIESRIR